MKKCMGLNELKISPHAERKLILHMALNMAFQLAFVPVNMWWNEPKMSGIFSLN